MSFLVELLGLYLSEEAFEFEMKCIILHKHYKTAVSVRKITESECTFLSVNEIISIHDQCINCTFSGFAFFDRSLGLLSNRLRVL